MILLYSLLGSLSLYVPLFFFFNETATTEIYTLSLHDALPISPADERGPAAPVQGGDAGGAQPEPGRDRNTGRRGPRACAGGGHRRDRADHQPRPWSCSWRRQQFADKPQQPAGWLSSSVWGFQTQSIIKSSSRRRVIQWRLKTVDFRQERWHSRS